MRAFVLILLFGVYGTAWGAEETWYQNTHLLPQYCKDKTKGAAHPAWRKWRRVFGEVHIHIHHYCEGIFSEFKARSTMDTKWQKYYMRNAVKQMRYVSNNGCKVGCVLYPELHRRWAWALAGQGDIGNAVQHFRLSIKAKPDYVPAYAGLSDLYVDIAKPEEAGAVLEEGLRAAPKSRTLKRKLQKLKEVQ